MDDRQIAANDRRAREYMKWLVDEGYINPIFEDPRLSYIEARIDVDIWPS